MINKLKYKILQWLTSDIINVLDNKPGINSVQNIRAVAEINHMAIVAWRINDL